MTVQTITWEQVAAWRMSRQGLLQRTGKDGWVETVGRIGGLQAQVMSAAELAVWARADDVQPADIQRAIGEERKLAKTWMMRGTLHLLPAAELSTVLAALRATVSTSYRKPAWLKHHGITLEQLDELLAGARQILGSEPMTRGELADALVGATGHAELKELLLSGWGALLKPVAHEGLLVFGPNQGQNVTFVRPARWLSEWKETDISPEEALKQRARRYLSVYGPAAYEDFGRWWGADASKVKKLFRSLEDEIAPITIEGREGWALRATLAAMGEAAIPDGTVRLLPHFDPYTVSLSHRTQFVLNEQHKPKVYRNQGWIYPVVLVNGRMAGIWEADRKRDQLELKFEWFGSSPLTPSVRAGLESEAARLAAFYDTDVMMRG